MSERKGSSIAVIGVLLILVIAGFSIGFFAGTVNTLGSLTPNKNHQIIAEALTIHNIPYQVDAVPKYVGGGNAVPLTSFGQGGPEAFSYNTPYDYSDYVYKVQKDTNAYVKIYGPANDGETYYVMFVSSSMHQLNVSYPISPYWQLLTLDNPRFDLVMKVTD